MHNAPLRSIGFETIGEAAMQQPPITRNGAPSLASDSPSPRIAFLPTRFRSPHRNGLAEIRHFVM